MTSKAARKRNKKARISLPGGQQVEQRAPTDPRRENAEDPTLVVAIARMRKTGIKDQKDAIQPICGTDVGLCIRSMVKGDEFTALVNAWEALSASHANFRMLIVGQTGNPKGATIAMVPDRMEVNQSLRVDLRTPEERISAARASWEGWERKINALPIPQLKWAIRGALNGFMGEGQLWRDGAPTVTGKTTVAALRALAGEVV